MSSHRYCIALSGSHGFMTDHQRYLEDDAKGSRFGLRSCLEGALLYLPVEPGESLFEEAQEFFGDERAMP